MRQESVNPFKAKQLVEYCEEGLKYLDSCQLLSKYISRISVRSEAGAATIRYRVNSFGLFAFKTFPQILLFDYFLRDQGRQAHPYDLLANYAAWLSKEGCKPNQHLPQEKLLRKFCQMMEKKK